MRETYEREMPSCAAINVEIPLIGGLRVVFFIQMKQKDTIFPSETEK